MGTIELSLDHLPHGFEDCMRANNKGLLIRGWAPQLMILSHPLTVGFLSHCGWNSVLESISHIVPIIGLPISTKQFCNSKLLEEEVGVVVSRISAACQSDLASSRPVYHCRRLEDYQLIGVEKRWLQKPKASSVSSQKLGLRSL
eukprot:Gb_04176 [translate_table: standard]